MSVSRAPQFEIDSAAVRDSMRDMTSMLERQVERNRKTAGSGGEFPCSRFPLPHVLFLRLDLHESSPS